MTTHTKDKIDSTNVPDTPTEAPAPETKTVSYE